MARGGEQYLWPAHDVPAAKRPVQAAAPRQTARPPAAAASQRAAPPAEKRQFQCVLMLIVLTKSLFADECNRSRLARRLLSLARARDRAPHLSRSHPPPICILHACTRASLAPAKRATPARRARPSTSRNEGRARDSSNRPLAVSR